MSLAEELDALAVLDALSGRTENPLAAAGFAKLTEGSVNNIGQVTSTGWTTVTEKQKAGFKYTGTLKSSAAEFAVLATFAVLPGANGQIVECGWLYPGEKYVAVWLERTSATTYNANFDPNAAGVGGFSFTGKTWAAGDRFALCYDAGSLKLMRKPTATGVWEEVGGKALTLTGTPERPYWDFQPGASSSSTAFRLTSFSAGTLASAVNMPTASASGTSSASATITVPTRVQLTGSVAGTSSAAAEPRVQPRLTGSVAGTSSAAAAIIVLEPPPPPLPRSTKPPLALAIEIETADGWLSRLDPSSDDASMRPQAISFSTQRGEGCGPGAFSVTRKVMRDYPDLNLIDTVRAIGMNGEVPYEGRNHDYARTNDPVQQFAVTLQGWYSAMKDRKFSEIYVDRELAGWSGPSTSRRAALAAAGYRMEAEPDTNGWQANGSIGPSIIFTFQRFDSASKELGEAWYWGGGPDLGEVVIDLVVITGAPDPSFVQAVWLSSDDLGTILGPISTSGKVSKNNMAAISGGSGKKFAVLGSEYAGTFTGDTNEIQAFANPRVFGAHNLTKQGPAGEESFLVSDMLEDIVTRFTALSWHPDNLRTNYGVRQAAFRGQYPDDAAKSLNDYHLLETGVFEDKLFRYWQADLTRPDWIVRTDDPGVRFTPLQGDSIDSFANGVEVTFTDFTGRTYTLYPSDFAELRDESETNPANRHGIDLWTDFTVPYPCLLADALQIGRAYLAEYNRPKAPGTISIAGGYIRDAERHWQQGWKPRASETIALVNHPNDAPRLITQTNWDQDSKVLRISVDNGYQLLQAYLARMANARSAANL